MEGVDDAVACVLQGCSCVNVPEVTNTPLQDYFIFQSQIGRIKVDDEVLRIYKVGSYSQFFSRCENRLLFPSDGVVEE